MGFEYAGRPDPSLNGDQLQAIRNEIAADPFLVITRDESDQLGIVFKNEKNEDGWNEQVMIALSPNEIYLVFHLNDSRHQARIFDVLQRAFISNGITCHLGEL